MKQEALYAAWLKSIKGITNAQFRVLTADAGSPEAVFNAAAGKTLRSRVPAALKNTLLERADSSELTAIEKQLELMGADVITEDDARFPACLRELDDAPPLIYTRGKPRDLNSVRKVAVIGSRRCSPYGEKTAYSISRRLAELGVCVISGLAFGIDGRAHEGALSSGNDFATAAVLPGGVEQARPSGQSRLFEEIIKHGMVISENPPGSQVTAYSFPVRNRIIAAIADAVLVVEAAIKSGTNHTVNTALELGKEVFAVPGRIDDPYAAGTLQLIKDGAALTTDAEQIMQTMGWDYFEKPDGLAESSRLQELTPEETRIAAILKSGEKSVDDIIEKSGFAPHKTLSLLTKLSTKGIIERNNVNIYSLLI